jgi:hypothetical protein
MNLAAWMQSRTSGGISDSALSTAYFNHPVQRITQALNRLHAMQAVDVLFFTHRPEYFDRTEIEAHSSPTVHSVTFCSTEAELWSIDRTFDLAICCTHLTQDHLPQLAIRSRDLAKVVVAWAWDNHHDAFHNLCNASLADIVLPAHAYCRHRLKFPHYILGRTTPLCTAQWGRRFANGEILRSSGLARSNSLQGGYVLWEGSARNEALLRLRAEIPNNSIELLDADQRSQYFNLSAGERLRKWRSFKTSIQVPLDRDVSLRIFDALLAGQIPIVPVSCTDLDLAVPLKDQQALPIIRIPDLSTATVENALQTAIQRYGEMGVEGMLQRHQYAAERHHAITRINDITDYILGLSSNLCVTLSVDESGIGFEIPFEN